MCRIEYNNVIIISGARRNVGKTYLACKLIEYFSQHIPVIGVKVSPHFHTLSSQYSIIVNNKNFIIVDDCLPSNKDSYLMKKSGALHAYYIQCKSDEFLLEAFNFIALKHNTELIVVESGGLIKYVNPKKFVFICDENIFLENKTVYLRYNPILINSSLLEKNEIIENYFKISKFVN